MKKKILFMQCLSLAVLALGLGSCAEENVSKDGNDGHREGKYKMGGYISEDAKREAEAHVASARTRMTGVYGKLSDGVKTGIRFFFDEDEDKQYNGTSNYPLLVNYGTDVSPNWRYFPKSGATMQVEDTDPITGGVIRATWEGDTKLEKPEYKVRYGSSASGGYCSIRNLQQQLVPGKATHLRQYGDYATATAEDNGLYYNFTLKHHSAYITFMPYAAAGDSHDALASCKLLRVKIYSDQQMYGNFPVNDEGFNITSWGSGGLNTGITLWCISDNYISASSRTDYTANFPISANKAAAADKGAIMVLAPGTYNNVTIEYLLWDPVIKTFGTFKKKIASLTLNSGKNKPIYSALSCKDYTAQFFNTYHMWGAKETYWNGFTPYHNWSQNGNLFPSGGSGVPTSGDRYYSNVNGNISGAVDAPVGSLDRDAPTVMLLHWYTYKGDPRHDPEPFTYDGHLFNGRLWFKKATYISGASPTTPAESSYNDQYTGGYFRESNSKPWSEVAETSRNQYFYILPLGGYYAGSLYMVPQFSGNNFRFAYWTSTALYNSTDVAWTLQAQCSYDNEGNLSGVYMWPDSTYPYMLIPNPPSPDYCYRTYGLPKWPGETLTY